jgi:Ca2+/Na+ antiporter
VSEARLDHQRRILAFAAIVEVGTGLALMVDPAIVVSLLVGAELSGVAAVLGRCFGITLVALGLACWPGPRRAEGDSPAFRAMLTYNSLIALYLAYLGTLGHLRGFLLWPAVALHVVVALLLIWARRGKRRRG